MAMLKAYFDESGTHAGSKAIGVAGYLASETQWTRFEHDWKRILDKYGIQFFHMKDWEKRQTQFNGWSQQKKHELFGELVPAIRRNVIGGISVFVPLEHYRGKVAGCPSPYTICLLACLARIGRWADAHNHRDRIGYVFEDGARCGQEIFQFMRYIKKNPELRAKFRLGAYSLDDKKTTMPLQAADVLAYEEYKEMCNYYIPRKEVHPVRKTRSILLKGQEWRYKLDYFDESVLTIDGSDDSINKALSIPPLMPRRSL